MNFERSRDTDAIVVILRGVNDTISYADLAKRASVGVARVKATLASARRILRNEQIMFGTITGWGLKRMSDVDKITKSESTKKRMRSAAKRGLKELDTIVNFELLAPTQQLMATTNRSIFALIHQQAAIKPSPTSAAKPDAQEAATQIINLPKRA